MRAPQADLHAPAGATGQARDHDWHGEHDARVLRRGGKPGGNAGLEATGDSASVTVIPSQQHVP